MMPKIEHYVQQTMSDAKDRTGGLRVQRGGQLPAAARRYPRTTRFRHRHRRASRPAGVFRPCALALSSSSGSWPCACLMHAPMHTSTHVCTHECPHVVTHVRLVAQPIRLGTTSHMRLFTCLHACLYTGEACCQPVGVELCWRGRQRGHIAASSRQFIFPRLLA